MQPVPYQKPPFALESHTWKEACLEDSKQNTAGDETSKGLGDALTDSDNP